MRSAGVAAVLAALAWQPIGAMAQTADADIDPAAIAKQYARFPAPVGHRQPSVRDVEKGQSNPEKRPTRGSDLNERGCG